MHFMQAKTEDGGVSQKGKVLLLFAIMVIILVLAIISFLPSNQTPLKKCLGVVLQQNRNACLSALALNTKNASICSYLQGGYEASCYASMGEELSNLTLCQSALAINSSYGSSCIANVSYSTGNFSPCSTLNASDEYACATKVGIKLENASACSILSNGTDMAACVSSVSFIAAVSKHNPSLCSLVSQNNSTSFSRMVMANVGSMVENLFGNMTTYFDYLAYISQPPPSPQDLCYLSSAIASKNASVCSSITSQNVKTACLSYIKPQNVTEVNYTSELNLCESAGEIKSACINAVLLSEALQTRNATICGKLNATESLICYSNLAIKYKNTTYCGYIANAIENSACVYGVKYNSTGT